MSLTQRLAKALPPNSMTGQTKLRLLIDQQLRELSQTTANLTVLDAQKLTPLVYNAIQIALEQSATTISAQERANLIQQTVDEVLGNGPLDQLIRDTAISEILVVKYDSIYVEVDGRLQPSKVRFTSESALRKTIDRLVARVGRRIDESSPLVDARMPDGSRLNAVIPPVALDGATLNIRKFGGQSLGLKNLVQTRALTEEMAKWLAKAIASRKNIIVSGATGSGKTTFLNALSAHIGADERVVTIEDAAELQFNHSHVVRLEARPVNSEGAGLVTVRDLVKNALRMRPDRIVVGEVRDAAAIDMLQAMTTGHDGSLTTVHANSAPDALRRIEMMCLLAGLELPIEVVRQQLVSAIDVVVQLQRDPNGKRTVAGVYELQGITAAGQYVLSQVETS